MEVGARESEEGRESNRPYSAQRRKEPLATRSISLRGNSLARDWTARHALNFGLRFPRPIWLESRGLGQG